MDLERLADRLRAGRDMTGWWPAETSFEVMVGAILTQQTTWESTSRAIAALRREGLLEVDRLALCPQERLRPLVRCTGFYRQKAARLVAMADHIVKEHDGSAEVMLDQATSVLREELLGLPGIGPETADSILLFAADRPSFVAASYVSRVLGRTGIHHGGSYAEVQGFVHRSLPPDAARYRELYALIVDHARNTCLKDPRCSICPLDGECAYSVTSGRR